MREHNISWHENKTWRAFSEYQRLKYPICRICSRRETTAIHHIILRSHSAYLLFDTINCIALCHACHSKLHPTTPKRHSYDFIEQNEIFERIIGRDGLEYLAKHRHDMKSWRRDELDDIYNYCKQKIKILEGG